MNIHEEIIYYSGLIRYAFRNFQQPEFVQVMKKIVKLYRRTVIREYFKFKRGISKIDLEKIAKYIAEDFIFCLKLKIADLI